MATDDKPGPASPPASPSQTDMNESGTRRQSEVISNGVKLLGEAVLPGSSQLLEKRVGKGAVFAGVGLGGPPLMVAMLGPVAGGIVGGAIAIGSRVLSYWDSLPERTQGLLDQFDIRKTPVDILEERYARGEINTNDYKERRRALESGS